MIESMPCSFWDSKTNNLSRYLPLPENFNKKTSRFHKSSLPQSNSEEGYIDLFAEKDSRSNT